MGFEYIDQPSWSSEVECIPKMSISFYWLERGGRWGLSSLNSPANHQKLKIIQNEDFIFWLERGGEWGLSPSNSSVIHQKLSVIQKQAFHFIGWGWVVDRVWVHWPVWPKSEVDCNTKMSISLFWLERGGRWVRVHWPAWLIIRSWTKSINEHFVFLAGEAWWMAFRSIYQPGWSSEVERIPKMSISFFWLERVGRWGSSPSTSPADHQKFNVIQKWGFHFFG